MLAAYLEQNVGTDVEEFAVVQSKWVKLVRWDNPSRKSEDVVEKVTVQEASEVESSDCRVVEQIDSAVVQWECCLKIGTSLFSQIRIWSTRNCQNEKMREESIFHWVSN